MGTWGYKALENDDALDLLAEYEDTNSVSVLTEAIQTIVSKSDEECVDSTKAASAVAAAQIILDNNLAVIDKSVVKIVLERILNESELMDLWKESNDFDKWKTSVNFLISKCD